MTLAHFLAEADLRPATRLAGTLAYGVSTIACLLAATRTRAGERRWWIVLTAFAAALTADLELNFRFALAGFLSGIAKAGHWYPERRPVQVAVLAVAAVAAPLLLATLLWLVRKYGWPLRVAMIGAAMAVLMLGLEILSLHQTDEILDTEVGPLMAVGVGWVLAAALLTVGASLRCGRRERTA